MKRTMIVMSTNRDIEQQTQRSIEALRRLGAIRLVESGSTDVSLARNRALTAACRALREHMERDVVLMLDDDMEVPAEVAQELVDKARELGEATSAVYATANAYLAGMRWKAKRSHWLVGLGCVAIPRALLLELEERSETFKLGEAVFSEFTWSCAEDGNWYSEDFRLCMNLGGAVLLPLPVGHVKKGVIWPDEITIERLKNGEELTREGPLSMEWPPPGGIPKP